MGIHGQTCQCDGQAMSPSLNILLLLLLFLSSFPVTQVQACNTKLPTVRIEPFNASHLEVVYTNSGENEVVLESGELWAGREHAKIDDETNLANIDGDAMDRCKEQDLVIVFNYKRKNNDKLRQKTINVMYTPDWGALDEIKSKINSSICLKEKEIVIEKDLKLLRRDENLLFNICFKEISSVTENNETGKKISNLSQEINSLGMYEDKVVKIQMVMQTDKNILVYEGQDLGERPPCKDDPSLILGMSIASFSGVCVSLVILVILVISVVCVFTMNPYTRQRLGLQKFDYHILESLMMQASRRNRDSQPESSRHQYDYY